MIPRICRMRKNKEFQTVYKRGRSYGGKFVVLYQFQNKGISQKLPRFGYSVSSKVGKAVTRNLIKRWLREICRKNLPYLRTDYDIILIARQKIKGIPFALVEEDVVKLFKRARLYVEKKNNESN